MWRNHRAMVMNGLLRNLWAVPASACNLISPDTRRRSREVLRMTTDNQLSAASSEAELGPVKKAAP